MENTPVEEVRTESILLEVLTESNRLKVVLTGSSLEEVFIKNNPEGEATMTSLKARDRNNQVVPITEKDQSDRIGSRPVIS